MIDSIFGSSKEVRVTPDTAMTWAPIWYSVNKIAGHVGQLPLVLHKRLDKGSERATDHPSFSLMKSKPNAWQTPMVFKQQLQAHSLLHGNSFAFIVRTGDMPDQLLPLDPGNTGVRMEAGEKIYYHMPMEHDPILKYKKPMKRSDIDGNFVGDVIRLRDYEVMHVPGLGFDGIAGLSLWKVASESWSIGMHADRRMRIGFEKGFKSAMLIEAPDGMFRDPKKAKEFIDDFNKFHSGSSNADKVGLLREGMKTHVTQMSGQDAQVIENRRYQRQDAALWFLLESILGDDSSVSYNSLEQKNLAYLSNCLMRWLITWEEECNRKLLTQQEQVNDSHYFKFNVAALLRSDMATSMSTLSLGINSRIYSPNEAREKLELNPYEGGDEYANPSITPGSPESKQTAHKDDTASNKDTATAAVRSRIMWLILVEKKRVTVQAEHSKNFVDWLGKFYQKWEPRLAKGVADCIGNDEDSALVIAGEYCEQSIDMLIQCAVKAKTKDELGAVVGECVSTWDARADDLIQQMEQVF